MQCNETDDETDDELADDETDDELVAENEEIEYLKEAFPSLYVSGLQLLSHSVFVCREATSADDVRVLQSAPTNRDFGRVR